mmetsp:Transcript_23257/g.64505  ORF Transcript_23257/g.64505 Transcript_23257/m.64505 type:complete len:495 (-) Transcript_23257:134-1618(-)|eukprot:CAMPEP_0172366618 /NCGR_PEP_ID=MMETSP1060-20121228/16173_1 /TAXON_ID=37318 /ORGANISM="Pseudo-nitzschia pungens, Strain cf. cingulata" /LENGTH=494 /DNA_ID=CAMNT_0013090547 /DNA_START=56 /DNA_END=1540 /DNA_ORIENTATION=-
MVKKGRSKRRSRGNDSDEDDDRSVNGAADYLSESHTIDGLLSHNGDTTTVGSMADDASWGIHDDDDDAYQKKGGANNTDQQSVEANQQKLSDILGSTVPEFASEKRSSKREAMLKAWFKALTHYATLPPYDVVEEWREELVKACGSYALLRGSPSEQYAGCRVLEAMAVLVADHGLYDLVAKRLVRTIQGTHKAVPVRVSALRALGMVVFCGIEDDMITESVLDLCEAVLRSEYRGQPTPPALRACAWQVWTLLATSIHELYVAGKNHESTGRGLLLLSVVSECLESDDHSLKEAAGQAMAFIHDCRLRLGVDALGGDDERAETRNATDAKYTLGSWEGSEWEGDVDEITQTIYELAHASGHYLSKKAKKEQRYVFRDYLGMLQDNETPEVVVQFRGGSLELTSFGDICALDFVKRCLQGGFQIQLLTNPTLQAIFGCDGVALGYSNGYSQLEKRLLLSKTSEAAKLKDQDRHKGRKKRQNVKNHFLTADGDDI